MKSTKTQLFTLTILFFSFLGFSQTSLEGKLTDAKTGDPMIGVNISLNKNGISILETESNLDGNYFFSNIKSGIYNVVTDHTGYISQKQTGVTIKAGRTNRLDISITEGLSINGPEIIEYKIPLLDSSEISLLYTDDIISTVNSINSDIVSSFTSTGFANKSSITPHLGTSTPISSTGRYSKSEILPSSGQITAGEWNDLHNWKDWMRLMEDEDYSIMTERFEIYPTQRYSVIAINEDKAVIPNVPVKLIDNNNNIIWETITDNAGKAELWSQPFINSEDYKTYKIIIDGKNIEDPKTIDQGSNTVFLKQDCFSSNKMDIVFTVDATSSMNDEILFLKSELLDVIDRIQETNQDVEYRTGSVFYRDARDDYITRVSPLSENEELIIDFVMRQNAQGGGDKPEAVEMALEETLNLDWNKEALKLVFLILDAPPHEDEATMIKIRSQIKDASSKGIKLIPITASGIGRETEFLMKFMAMMTNGTYVFITDDSGIGEAHLAPVVTDYEVEKLNDCMVRLITQYSKSYSCESDYLSENEVDINIYPNPSTQYINVETNSIAKKINILSSNGMIVKSVKPLENTTRIELDDLINGIYTAVIYLGGATISKQIILLK